MKYPLVSITITTRNSQKFIKDCLDSVVKQTYPKDKIEIIVVDNHSLDNTKQLALRYTDKVHNQGPERSAQRNYGAKKSTGKYYLYLDSDMRLGKRVIEESVRKLEENPKLIALYIPEIILGKSIWSRVRRFERSFYNATPIDCVRFIRIRDFRAVQGFDETMTGPEDWDFDKKIRGRGRVDIIASPLFHNEIDFNLRSYLNKKSYYSTNMKYYIEKWGNDDEDIKKQLGLSYRYFSVFMEKGKWKKLITNPHLAAIMIFLKILVGFQYLRKSLWKN